MRCNEKIRRAMGAAGLKQYEVAEALGMLESSFSRKLRDELPEDEQKRILDVIKGLSLAIDPELEDGFLVNYEWLAALKSLPGEEFKKLLEAAMDFEQEGKPFPHFEDERTYAMALFFEPVIQRRRDNKEI